MPYSFAPTTAVLLADGTTKPIKDVQPGDHVLSTDPESSITQAKPVTAQHINQDLDLTDITVTQAGAAGSPNGHGDAATTTLYTTQHHPFWDQTTQTWTDAADLIPNHQLRTPDGAAVTITAVRNHTGRQEMRNLTIADSHTYYVVAGTTPVLVHNCGDARFPVDSGGTATDLRGTIDPNRVRFTQDSAGSTFKDGRSVADLANGLADGGVNPANLPPIRIFEHNGELFSLDNRRLFAGQYAGVELPYVMATPREIAGRLMTYVDGGGSIKIRGIGWWSTG